MGDAPHRARRKLRYRAFVAPWRFERAQGKTFVTLDQDTIHHLRNVLRLGPGDRIAIFDNTGDEHEAELTELTPRHGRAVIESTRRPEVESPLKIVLAQSLLKGNALDRLLTLATELGVAGFIPLFTARTVVNLTRVEAADRVKRWERLVAEASAQSGRVLAPRVEMPLTLEELCGRPDPGLKIVLWESGGAGQFAELTRGADLTAPVILLAGPEGGFEPAEVEQAQAAGYRVWGLGPRILRAESAGPAAIAILQHAAGDMG